MSEKNRMDPQNGDSFAVYPCMSNSYKRRLIRLRSDNTKRQCWELYPHELENLYKTLGRQMVKEK